MSEERTYYIFDMAKPEEKVYMTEKVIGFFIKQPLVAHLLLNVATNFDFDTLEEIAEPEVGIAGYKIINNAVVPQYIFYGCLLAPRTDLPYQEYFQKIKIFYGINQADYAILYLIGDHNIPFLTLIETLTDRFILRLNSSQFQKAYKDYYNKPVPHHDDLVTMLV